MLSRSRTHSKGDGNVTREERLEAEVQWLRTKLEEREYEITDLKQELGYQVDGDLVEAQRARGLTRKQNAQIMAALYARRGHVVTRLVLDSLIPGYRDEMGGFKWMDVQAHNIRAILGFGSIITVWGTGFAIGLKGIEFCEQALAASKRRVA